MKKYIIIIHMPYEGSLTEIIEEKELKENLKRIRDEEKDFLGYKYEIYEIGNRVYITK